MKRIAVLFCFFFVVVVLSQEAIASTQSKPELPADEKWEFYDFDEEGTHYSYNPKTIKRLSNNIVRVWVKALYTEKNLTLKKERFYGR